MTERVMSTEDRLDRLEQRMAVLETLVRQLAAGSGAPRAPAPSGAPPAPPVRRCGSATAGEPRRRRAARPARPPPPPAPPPRPPSAAHRRPAPGPGRTARPRSTPSSGSASACSSASASWRCSWPPGYLLKLSFDRGWISPVMRCVGGVVAGIAVGALGWRLEPRYRTYGAALIGAGAGIIYLSVWAASRLYGVLPSATGIVGLALVSVALAMIAYAINVEALGVTAALGAFFAPVLLGQNQANADLLLLYLASMAAGLGLVAARRRWRLAVLVDRGQLLRRRHRRRGGPRRTRGACCSSAWSAGRAGLYVGSAGALVGDPPAHLLRRLDAARRGRRADPAALGGAGRGNRAVGAGLVARAPAAAGLPASSRAARRRGRLVAGRGALLLRHAVAARLGGARPRRRAVRRQPVARRR